MEILVLGSNGQVSSELKAITALMPDWVIDFVGSKEVDMSVLDSAKAYFEGLKRYDWVFNCAAYTAVDKAESDVEKCYNLNTELPKILVAYSARTGAIVLHISSDYVYHPMAINYPIVESLACSPQGVYAKSKHEGDLAFINQDVCNYLIIRTSWVYSRFGANFVKTMLRLGRERAGLSVVADQIGSPTNAADLAAVMFAIVEQIGLHKKDTRLNAVYNYSNEGVCSWYDFAHEIFRQKQVTCALTPIVTAEYPTPAMRPHWSYMSKKLISSQFNLTIPHWQTSLAGCLSLLD